MRRLLVLPCFAILAIPVWAQDTSEAETPVEDTPAVESTETSEDQAEEGIEDDAEVDALYSEEDDDKFIPSEDVAFGQSIPFPTDI